MSRRQTEMNVFWLSESLKDSHPDTSTDLLSMLCCQQGSKCWVNMNAYHPHNNAMMHVVNFLRLHMWKLIHRKVRQSKSKQQLNQPWENPLIQALTVETQGQGRPRWLPSCSSCFCIWTLSYLGPQVLLQLFPLNL